MFGKKIISNETNEIYTIAEIGVNHEGSLKKAFELIELVADSGCDGAKFQTYKAEKIAAVNSPAYWDQSLENTASQYLLFKKYDAFNQPDYVKLAEYCQKWSIDFLSTPFDVESVCWLAELVPFFKVSSSDITHVPLLRAIGKSGKPVLLSTGASDLFEIRRAMSTLAKAGAGDICLMHCVLNYPTANADANLKMISHLKREFPNTIIGYSDHTVPDQEMTCLLTAYDFGARVFEKHFTDDKALPGNDHYHSMDVNDAKTFLSGVDLRRQLIGEAESKYCLDVELKARKYARRGIYVTRNIDVGQRLTERDLICKRPNAGVCASEFDEIIGKRTITSIAAGEALTMDYLGE